MATPNWNTSRSFFYLLGIPQKDPILQSQLILAAINYPTANLNELIEAAAGFMSEGITFGSSRESLKKSLTVARKAAENGEFKLKCYKNSGSNGGGGSVGVSMVNRPKHPKSGGGGSKSVKKGQQNLTPKSSVEPEDSNTDDLDVLIFPFKV
jgi:hypothetical protein